jgi:hypothetical protein
LWAEWESKKDQGDAEEIMAVLQACEVKLKQMEDWTAHQKQQQQQSMVYLQQVSFYVKQLLLTYYPCSYMRRNKHYKDNGAITI